MAAGKKNIIVEKGATFKMVLTWNDSNNVPVNLTGYTARMQVRKTVNDSVKLLDLTTENGAIVLGGALGTITITGLATDTAAIASGIKSGVYDLELVSGAVVTRLLEGTVEIRDEVTR
jgi:hypothetical protein